MRERFGSVYVAGSSRAKPITEFSRDFLFRPPASYFWQSPQKVTKRACPGIRTRRPCPASPGFPRSIAAPGADLGGPLRRAIPGQSQLSRHPCRSSSPAGPLHDDSARPTDGASELVQPFLQAFWQCQSPRITSLRRAARISPLPFTGKGPGERGTSRARNLNFVLQATSIGVDGTTKNAAHLGEAGARVNTGLCPALDLAPGVGAAICHCSPCCCRPPASWAGPAGRC
ncbi:hypothetical protein SAMN05216186_12212 [Pseudomonas indica]|uniref:Uncharacterized protein n=1 Tax=Pseudomonas indica TaxID=137658 RepID=A0A1G9KCU0_9PSED|nr:hypothetical protein SAMN05216186_12212 [Pseudomonas indica]